MPMIKPVTPVYNPAHPLSQGLIACWPFVEMEKTAPVKVISPYSDANGNCYGFNTSGRVATPYGAGVRQDNDGGYIYASVSPIYAPVAGKFTYAILARFNNPNANYGNISRNYVSNTGFTFHFGGTTGQLRLTIGYGTGTFNWFAGGSPVISANRWYMLGFSFDGTATSNGPLKWWYDGVPWTVNGSAGIFVPSTTVFRPVADNLNGDVAGAWMWGRCLSDADWKMLMYDPFAMTRPMKRIWKPAAQTPILPTNKYLRWGFDTPKVITGNGTATIAISQRAILTISHRNKATFSMAEVPRFSVPAGVNIRPLAVFSDDEFTVEIENVSCAGDIAYSWSRRGIL